MAPSATSAAHGNTTLSDEQLGMLREMLTEQRSFRLDQLDQLRRGDRAGTTGGDSEIRDSLIAGARAALHDVVDALARMDNGQYGTCRRCNRALSLARLEVLPQLALCVDCQRALAP